MENTDQDNIRAVGYLRVSQEKSALNGYGLGAQERDIKKHANYKDWNLGKLYQENGVSGYQKDRPALSELLQDAKSGKFDIVIFPSIDRVGRSVQDVIETDNYLHKHDIDTVFLREGIDTSTPTGALYRNIMSSVAEFEGKLIYERLTKGKREKASLGGYVGGWLPYGYDKKDGQIITLKEEAEIVEQIFTWRANRKSLKWIGDSLNQDNIATKRGGSWGVSTILGIIRNRYYTGRVEFEGTFIRAQHEAIVSDFLFQKVNRL